MARNQNVLSDKTVVEVINNSGGVVFYSSELNRTKRRWDTPTTMKKITLEELKELIGNSGGYELLRDDLLIKDVNVRQELGLPVEPEFMLDDDGIKELLERGLEELKNVLLTTTDAIKDNIARIAIQVQLSDLNKIEAIQASTGIDVLAEIKRVREEENEKNKTK